MPPTVPDQRTFPDGKQDDVSLPYGFDPDEVNLSPLWKRAVGIHGTSIA